MHDSRTSFVEPTEKFRIFMTQNLKTRICATKIMPVGYVHFVQCH